MVLCSRQIFVGLLLLSGIISANAQPAVDKASTSSISGKVTIGGKGASGFVVGLATETPSSSIHITRLKAVTDEDGNYRFKNVPPGTYKVMIAALAYVQSDGPTPVVIGKNEVAENIDVTLVRGGVITGKVIDDDGRPVLEEQVFFSLTTSSRALPFMRRVRTDDRGVYRAFGLPAGRYLVYAGKDSISSFGSANTGYQRTYHPSAVSPANATVIDINEGSEARDVNITLGRRLRKYTAQGRIIDGETSQPFPNAHIGIQMFFDDKVHAGSGYTSKTNAAESTKDGEFKIDNLPPGKYAVYLESRTESESLSEQVRFEVTNQDIEGLLIKTSKGATVSGVVVIEGPHDPTVRANLAGTKILASVSTESDGKPTPSANINPDGSFRLTGLPAGRLMLNLPQNRDRLRLMRIERDGVLYPGGIEIKAREQITGLRVVASQANGKIRGLLKLPDGMELSATARLLVWIRRTDSTVFNSAVEADARGRFLVDDLAPGTYEFNVGVVGVPNDQRPRITRPTQTVVVTNGAIADVTLTLQTPKTEPGKP